MDHHVDRRITRGLRSRGVDVLAAEEDGAKELPDDELLVRATQLGRILVTMDEDFHTIVANCWASGVEFSGCVFLQSLRLTISECIEKLELIAKATSSDEYWNKRVYLAEY